MPRPRLLDNSKRGAACALVAAGFSLNDVAERLGCSPRTLLRERALNDDFRSRLDEAELLSARGPLEDLQRAARTNWRAAAWLLERTDPQQFAPRRHARCRPAEFDAICTRLIEAALEDADDPIRRCQTYERLTQAADAVARELHFPPMKHAPPWAQGREARRGGRAPWHVDLERAPSPRDQVDLPVNLPDREERSENEDNSPTDLDATRQYQDKTRARFFGDLAAELRKSQDQRAPDQPTQEPVLSQELRSAAIEPKPAPCPPTSDSPQASDNETRASNP